MCPDTAAIFADYCVDGGRYRQAGIRGIKTCRQADIHLIRWATWRWRLLAQAADISYISKIYRERHEKIKRQAINDGYLVNPDIAEAKKAAWDRAHDLAAQ